MDLQLVVGALHLDELVAPGLVDDRKVWKAAALAGEIVAHDLNQGTQVGLGNGVKDGLENPSAGSVAN